MRFEHFSSKKTLFRALDNIFSALCDTFGGRMRYIVLNAGSFNFVLMPVHKSKNGEVPESQPRPKEATFYLLVAARRLHQNRSWIW